MLDRIRIWFAKVTGRSTSTRRISRREREESQRRLLIIGISITAIVLVVVLSGGAFYQYIYYPGQTLASVNGSKISRRDYWKVRKLDLVNQVAQYSQMAQYATGSQATQYQSLAQQAHAQLQTVESDPIDPTTLKNMVDNLVIINGLPDLGITITNAELDQYQAQQFTSAPIGSPTPTLPIDPTAAAWATATAQAQATAAAQTQATAAAQQTAAALATAKALGTPIPTGSPAASATATQTSSAGGVATPSITSSGTPSGSPSAAGSPNAASPTPTISADAAQATATANFATYSKNVLSQTGMSAGDFRRLVLKPSFARQQVSNKLEAEVATRQTQIHAEHILVATQEAANAIVNTALKTKSFEEVAKAQSADSTTAPNGGDLGWIPKGIMSAQFDKVAFALKVGEVSQPFQTPFGWDIVKVIDRQDNRPVTAEMLTKLRSNKLNDWTNQERAKQKIVWNISAAIPSPTPQTQFVPPPDAPPTPTPLPTPTPTPAPPGTPSAGTPGAVNPTP